MMKRILTLAQTIPDENAITFGVIEAKKNGLHSCRIKVRSGRGALRTARVRKDGAH
jgi:hypothetical protein